jgi:hypothetical protein
MASAVTKERHPVEYAGGSLTILRNVYPSKLNYVLRRERQVQDTPSERPQPVVLSTSREKKELDPLRRSLSQQIEKITVNRRGDMHCGAVRGSIYSVHIVPDPQDRSVLDLRSNGAIG